jgi:hypothetical protein
MIHSLAATSLLLAIAIIPFWIRGFFVCDDLFWTGNISAHPQYHQQYSAVAWLERGMISIRWDRVRDSQPNPTPFPIPGFRHSTQPPLGLWGDSIGAFHWGAPRTIDNQNISTRVYAFELPFWGIETLCVALPISLIYIRKKRAESEVVTKNSARGNG